MASTASLAATSPVRCPPIPSATTKTPPQEVRAWPTASSFLGRLRPGWGFQGEGEAGHVGILLHTELPP
jgi:hypothetical protein